MMKNTFEICSSDGLVHVFIGPFRSRAAAKKHIAECTEFDKQYSCMTNKIMQSDKISSDLRKSAVDWMSPEEDRELAVCQCFTMRVITREGSK